MYRAEPYSASAVKSFEDRNWLDECCFRHTPGSPLEALVKQEKGQTLSSPPFWFWREARLLHAMLLGGEFFLFAFHAHGFELALFGFVGFHDLGLDLGCRFLELR